MGKGKLEKFDELKVLDNVIEPRTEELLHGEHPLKGNWHRDQLPHDGPIILELACGKGEYSVEMARRYPEMNFIGVDIKGNRIWNGAKRAVEEELSNVRFLRTQVEMIDRFFGPEEVEAIWLTFPDPQEKKRRAKKRLTGHRFLELYERFLRPGGTLHLKTDNEILYRSSKEIFQERELPLERDLPDLHHSLQELSEKEAELLRIRTFYEGLALEEGLGIKYLRTRLGV